MTRLLWFIAGALVYKLLREREDFEERLDEIEAEIVGRNAADEEGAGDAAAR